MQYQMVEMIQRFSCTVTRKSTVFIIDTSKSAIYTIMALLSKALLTARYLTCTNTIGIMPIMDVGELTEVGISTAMWTYTETYLKESFHDPVSVLLK